MGTAPLEGKGNLAKGVCFASNNLDTLLKYKYIDVLQEKLEVLRLRGEGSPDRQVRQPGLWFALFLI